MLTEQRHVTGPELRWIRDATARLLAVAESGGGPAGPRFVVFHGPVTEDSAGPVEVCVPVTAGRFDPAVTAVRTEPAHREAYAAVEPGTVRAADDPVRLRHRAPLGAGDGPPGGRRAPRGVPLRHRAGGAGV